MLRGGTGAMREDAVLPFADARGAATSPRLYAPKPTLALFALIIVMASGMPERGRSGGGHAGGAT